MSTLDRASEAGEAALWLALLGESGPGRRVAKAILHAWCLEERQPLAALFDLSSKEMAERLRLTAMQAGQVLAARRAAPEQEALLARWAAQGIEVATRADVAYPDALAERLPEEWLPYVLYYRGTLDVLTQPAFSVVGAAQPTAEGALLARELGAWLAAEGHGVVSGYSRGVERLALEAARGVGGAVVWVLPLGLGQAEAILRPYDGELAAGRGLALSPYAPETAYRDELAAARRVLIVALSVSLAAVEPDDGPADWASLPEFLRAGGRVLVWPGNPSWTEVGAVAADGLAGMQHEIEALFGGAPTEADAPGVTEIGEAPAFSAEPIEFKDADSAVEMLGRSGTVPDVLARRLAERLGKAGGGETEP